VLGDGYSREPRITVGPGRLSAMSSAETPEWEMSDGQSRSADDPCLSRSPLRRRGAWSRTIAVREFAPVPGRLSTCPGRLSRSAWRCFVRPAGSRWGGSPTSARPAVCSCGGPASAPLGRRHLRARALWYNACRAQNRSSSASGGPPEPEPSSPGAASFCSGSGNLPALGHSGSPRTRHMMRP
jgi:hypothetical protein